MKKRNSLIEFYRFFFAINVVKNHGFCPWEIPYMSPGRVSVEFFFILSGYLFLSYLERTKDEPLKKGVLSLICNKMKPLFFPVVIGLAANLVTNILEKEYFTGLWGYMWYIHAMIITYIAYYVIRHFIKSDKVFTYTVLAIFILATLMRFGGTFYSWGYVRAASAISLGMLVAKLPKLNPKRKFPIAITAAISFILSASVVIFELGNTEILGGFRIVELFLDTVLYPSLIYFTFQLNLSSRILNYLGALSFGLYAFQCPADMIRVMGVSNRYVLLAVIMSLTVAEDGIKRIIKYRKSCAIAASNNETNRNSA